MATGFEYKIFDLEDVLHYTSETLPDAFFAEDAGGKSKKDWEAALASGFRWIRTDGALVILEREYELVLGRKMLKGGSRYPP